MAYRSIINPILLCSLLVLAACESKQEKFPGEMTDEEWENRPTLEDIICDSIAEKEDISVECAAVGDSFPIFKFHVLYSFFTRWLFPSYEIYSYLFL